MVKTALRILEYSVTLKVCILLVAAASGIAMVLMSLPVMANEAESQMFRICVVDKDGFRVKEAKLFVSDERGVPTEIAPTEIMSSGQIELGDCGPGWRFDVENPLSASDRKAILELRFQADEDIEPAVDSVVTLEIRLFAPADVPRSSDVILSIPASVPTALDMAYLDRLESMAGEQQQIEKLIHATIMHDYLSRRYGASASVSRRAAVNLMNAATELIRPTSHGDSLFLVSREVIRRIERSFGQRAGYVERARRRLLEAQITPIRISGEMIDNMTTNGQCAAAREVLRALRVYVGDSESLLTNARVPLSHLVDLENKINNRCSRA